MSQRPDISIIIVNYNVKEFLANCLHSVKKASLGLSTEIIVVDNASEDGSMEYLKPRFRDVTFIENSENVGFGKANNQAIKCVTGKYTLFLNPDTLLQEDTLSVLKEHMDKNIETGACGCKIVNPDGTFAPESRRAIPTLVTAVYKALGLTALFPKSKLFGAYYQGWKGENEAGEVPVLSGSFMFFRTNALKEAGGFDERFFMYAEDIDLCYRVGAKGWKIDYIPETSIIHYKGESSKHNDMGYVWHFNNSLYLFFDKHYSTRYSSLFKIIVFAAILVRTFFTFITIHTRKFRYVVYDVIILNLALFTGYFTRFSFNKEEILERFSPDFLWLNLILSISYLVFGSLFGIVKKHKYSIAGSLKAVFLSFVALAVITFFVRDLAFSRIILITGGVLGFILVGFIRILRLNLSKEPSMTRGRFKPAKLIIAGVSPKTTELVKKLRNKVSWQVDIIGLVHQEPWQGDYALNQASVIGSLRQLSDLIKTTGADQVLYVLDTLSYSDILRSMVELKGLDVEMKIVSDDVNFILGKANVDYLDNLAVLDVDLNYFNVFQQLFKKIFDLAISVPLFLLLAPFMLPSWFIRQKELQKVEVFDGKRTNHISLLRPADQSRLLNIWLLMGNVARGKISLVGSSPATHASEKSRYKFKTGCTGYWQIHQNQAGDTDDKEYYDSYYLQNYSVWFDVDILIKSILRGSIPDQF